MKIFIDSGDVLFVVMALRQMKRQLSNESNKRRCDAIEDRLIGQALAGDGEDPWLPPRAA